jgi:hypothetical protein
MSLAAGAALVLGVALADGAEKSVAVADVRCPPGWSAVPVPGRTGALSGVAAASPNDAWAVGYRFMEHWNGIRWRLVIVPANRELSAITALAADDAWAVGSTGPRAALIEHWDGQAWTPVRLSRSAARAEKRLGAGASRILVAVSASADDDVWAVGFDQVRQTRAQIRANKFPSPFDIGVVLHSDGTAWKQVPTPIGVLRDVVPTGVVATSPENVWVIANASSESYGVAMHWNGRRWRTFHLRGPVPAIAGGWLTLKSITAVAPNDIRVSATEIAPDEGDDDSWGVIFRWNGQRWIRSIPEGQPVAPGLGWSYDAIISRSRTEVWVAANDASEFTQQGGAELFITGRRGPKNSMLQQLSQGYIIEAMASDSHTLWAVGWIGTGHGSPNDYSYAHTRPLIERNGC